MSSPVPTPLLIAVCGATGTGKSSFINRATGEDRMKVGHSQLSCTKDVEFASFELDGREIWLIDTPGFDDSVREDSEILGKIGTFLEGTYNQGNLLSGIIYMHRITDNRLGGVSRRNFRVFRELCGTKSLSNVIITTSMWHDPPEPIELEREQELLRNETLFQPAVAKGARPARYIQQRGVQSAHDIIRMCIPNTPKPTQYQEEIQAGASVSETSAGKALNQELLKLIERQRAEIEGLKREFQEALKAQDEESRRELEEEKKKSEATFAALMRDISNLNGELDKLREEKQTERREYDDQQKKLRSQINQLEAEIAGLLSSLSQELNVDERARLEMEIQTRREKVKAKRRAGVQDLANYCAGVWKKAKRWGTPSLISTLPNKRA